MISVQTSCSACICFLLCLRYPNETCDCGCFTMGYYLKWNGRQRVRNSRRLDRESPGIIVCVCVCVCVCRRGKVSERFSARVTPIRGVVTSRNQTLSLIEEETPFQNTWIVLERIKIWSWVPTRPETKVDCAGEDQQKFTRPTYRRLAVRYVHYVNQFYAH
jgi:hypothetical protein